MSDTLTLKPSGDDGCDPDPNPWEPEKGSSVKICNDSGYTQTLWDISPGLLNPSPGHKITVAVGECWEGTVGNAKGTYTYNDGHAGAGPRSGTIDPS